MTTTPTSGAADLPEARLFTKKPVTIAAIQWTGKNLREVIAFTDGPPDTRTTHAGMAWEAYTDLVARDGLKIYTLEGKMLASPGDWIIRGVKGEYYPCKPDIFEATYSPAALAAGQATAAQAGEYPALVCDYCGALTPDPWHSSGMLHGKMSKHIHSCDACAARGAQDTREQLTPERVKEIVRGAGYDQHGIPDTEREAFINGLRHGEQAHGIKGGQHGAK